MEKTRTTEIPKYVLTRLRQARPQDCCVVPNSTPVISFGDPRTARVATLGLNPSRVEFLDHEQKELDGTHRRLETLTCLGVQNLSDASEDVLRRVVEGCYGYFKRKPNRAWFDQLEVILKPLGASYYDGSACHLDLVQWATDPKWSELWDGVRTSLLRNDVPFLLEQLRNENIRLLLLNGRAVVDNFAAAAASIKLAPRPQKVLAKTQLFDGYGPKSMRIVGWSANLQSSHLRADMRREIAKAVAALALP